MKKIIILIPIYNDWESFNKLIFEISKIIEKIDYFKFDCILVNDASSIDKPKLKKPENFNSLKILHMKTNKGHARCNAFGLRYISENENFDNLSDEDEALITKSIDLIKNSNKASTSFLQRNFQKTIFQSQHDIGWIQQ